MYDLPDSALPGSPDYPSRDETQPCHEDSCLARLPEFDAPECKGCDLTFCREHLTDFCGELFCGECMVHLARSGSADADEQAAIDLLPQSVARRIMLHAAAGCTIEETRAALGGGR